jgi:hypothetical protein
MAGVTTAHRFRQFDANMGVSIEGKTDRRARPDGVVVTNREKAWDTLPAIHHLDTGTLRATTNCF